MDIGRLAPFPFSLPLCLVVPPASPPGLPVRGGDCAAAAAHAATAAKEERGRREGSRKHEGGY